MNNELVASIVLWTKSQGALESVETALRPMMYELCPSKVNAEEKEEEIKLVMRAGLPDNDIKVL